MIAEREVEVVNLDALTTAELLRERVDVRAAIVTILAQLQDKDRRPPAPEDNSSAWCAFRDWRKRARWALVCRRKELDQIKLILSERQDTAPVGRLMKQLASEEGRAAIAARESEVAERRERLLAALEEQTTEGLLLAAYRVIRHLLTEGAELPESLDAQDRDALGQISLALRAAYGRDAVKQFTEPAS